MRTRPSGRFRVSSPGTGNRPCRCAFLLPVRAVKTSKYRLNALSATAFPLLPGADADDFYRERPARTLVAHHVARRLAEYGLAERRRRREHVELVVALLDRPDEVGGGVVVTLHAQFDDRARGHDLAVRAFDHDRIADERLDLADPRLVQALLVLGGVVICVLGDVAVLAGPFDPQ